MNRENKLKLKNHKNIIERKELKMKTKLTKAIENQEERRREMNRKTIFESVEKELAFAYRKHGSNQWGRHEFYAIMKEEVDEVWGAVKKDIPLPELKKEIIQVIAVCVRYGLG